MTRQDALPFVKRNDLNREIQSQIWPVYETQKPGCGTSGHDVSVVPSRYVQR